MSLRHRISAVLLGLVMALPAMTVWAQQQTSRVVGTVRDETNAIALPGTPVEVVATKQVVYTDVDGRYVLTLPGTQELRVALDGYQENRSGRNRQRANANRGHRYRDEPVRRDRQRLRTGRRRGDILGCGAADRAPQRRRDHRQHGSAGDACQRRFRCGRRSRVTGMSVIDNQYVFVRGLGERYSNTTLAGAVIPTTDRQESRPARPVPGGPYRQRTVAKSYSADKSAEFAGGLVQNVPLKLPTRPVIDLAYGINFYSTATGKSILMSPLNGKDVWGFDDGARALPASLPNSKIVRRGLYTPTVGYSPEEITAFGRAFENRWVPQTADGAPGQNWSISAGNRFDKLGVVTSVTHSYKRTRRGERRSSALMRLGRRLDEISNYDMQDALRRRSWIVGNLAYQFTPNHRIGIENFYTTADATRDGSSRAIISTTPPLSQLSPSSSTRHDLQRDGRALFRFQQPVDWRANSRCEPR
jgi:hypothetical protein